jgi:hypothetical protein
MGETETESDRAGNRSSAPGARRFPLRRRWDTRDWQTAGLLGLLVAVQCCGAVLAFTIGEWTRPFRSDVPMAISGAMAAPSTLLALWAVFGPQRVAVRLPLALWLIAVFAGCVKYGAGLEHGSRNAAGLGFALALLMANVAMQFLLWPLRMAGRWRLENTEHACGHVSVIGAGQFTVRALLGLTLAAASLLGGWRWLLPDASVQLKESSYLWRQACSLTLLPGLAGLLVLALAWIVLADGKRPVLRTVLFVLAIAGLMVGARPFAYVGWRYREVRWFETGALVNAFLSLAVVWVCGYRLTRRPSGSSGETISTARAPLGDRRSGSALAGLLMVSVGMACCVPACREHWRRAAISVDWRNRDMYVVRFDDEGEVIDLMIDESESVADDTLRQIAQLANLQNLNLDYLPIDDRQLTLLAPLAHLSLKRLALEGTDITDTGLELLGRFERLESLDVADTPITDDGLVHLHDLANLRELDLQGSLVTAQGVARLRTALPNCEITY